MAFVLEDGTGVVGANAFVDVSFITTYLTDRQRQTENNWSTSSNSLKQAAIIAATDYIEKVFGLRYLGRRKTAGQGLGWPRINVWDRDGYLLDPDLLPVVLEQATAEYAVRALDSALLPDPTVDDSGKAVTASTDIIGPIEETRKFTEGADIAFLIRPYPAADRLLEPLLVTSGRVIRG
jgi:hypothetical protein